MNLGNSDLRSPGEMEEVWRTQTNVPRRFLGERLQREDPLEARVAARAFFEGNGIERGRALCLLGVYGRGKTAAAVALMRALFDSRRFGRVGYLGWFLHFEQWAVKLDGYGSAVDAIAEGQKHKLVVFDEFGLGQSDTPRVLGPIRAVLSYRHANELPTVITSNLTLDKIAARYGEHLVDRLREWADVYELDGESKR